MSVANPETYLADLCAEMRVHWPENRLVNVVCHGHSVPAGYFATPFVDSFNAYPHLLHRALKGNFSSRGDWVSGSQPVVESTRNGDSSNMAT